MRDIVLILDDADLAEVDCSSPEAGNPGIGGAEYCVVTLATALAARGHRVHIIHHTESVALPRGPSSVLSKKNPDSMAEAINAIAPDWCIIKGSMRSSEIHELVTKVPSAKFITWVHNVLPWRILQNYGSDDRIVRVVFSGLEQQRMASDTRAFEKSIAIPTIFYPPRGLSTVERDPLAAVHVSSLTPSKGFHRVAHIWRRIRRAIPGAQLHVVGSAELYDRNATLGSLGIAEAGYERKFLKPFKGHPADYGVTFHGLMGTERFALMSGCSVGLPNPTGFTECFPTTVLEMSACGLAVVSMRKWGMCDTIIDGKTGFLEEDGRAIADRTVDLLSDPLTSRVMGENGSAVVADRYCPDRVALRWEREVFDEGPFVGPSLPDGFAGSYWWEGLVRNNASKGRVLGRTRDLCLKIDAWTNNTFRY